MASQGRQVYCWLIGVDPTWKSTGLQIISPPKQPTQLEVNWSPNFPSYKIIVDAAIFSAQKAAGVGVLIRDHEGNFIASLSRKIHAPTGTIKAEAKAFEAEITFAKEVGIGDFVLEGDSLLIVQVLKECSPTPSSVSALVYGMLAEFNEFRNVGFSHVRRQSNRPAHLLAKQALNLFDFSA